MSIMQQWVDNVSAAHEKGDVIIDELRKQTQKIADLISAVQSAGERTNTRRIQFADYAPAAGNLVLIVTAPVGVAWNLIALSVGADAAPTAINVYTETTDPINLIRVLAPGTRAYGDFPTGEYIGSGRSVLVELTGLAPGTRATLNLLVDNLGDA